LLQRLSPSGARATGTDITESEFVSRFVSLGSGNHPALAGKHPCGRASRPLRSALQRRSRRTTSSLLTRFNGY